MISTVYIHVVFLSGVKTTRVICNINVMMFVLEDDDDDRFVVGDQGGLLMGGSQIDVATGEVFDMFDSIHHRLFIY